MMRPFLDEDIKPLSEFRATVPACISQVRRTKRPVVITHRGTSAAVLLDVSEYEALVQKMEVLQDIRDAEVQLAGGQGVNHRDALREVLSRVAR